jgi:long-chain fatty acid transport protein
LGASITSNYGLATEYADDYAAGSMGGKTDLTTANFNLSGAYRLNATGALVLALMRSTPKRRLNVMRRDLGPIISGPNGALPPQLASPVSKIPADQQIARLKGDKWGFGWNAGILYEVDKNNRYGLTYRSEVKIDLTVIIVAI